jgi:hypothetical protein
VGGGGWLPTHYHVTPNSCWGWIEVEVELGCDKNSVKIEAYQLGFVETNKNSIIITQKHIHDKDD